MKLEIADEGTGHRLLQPGYFVAFKRPVEEGLALGQDLHVLKRDRDHRTSFEECSYAVLEVQREFHIHREWEIDQKVAKLIAELNGKGQSGKSALEFLRETLDAYSQFKKLQRARELQTKGSLTESERQLLEELKADADLKPFLPGDAGN